MSKRNKHRQTLVEVKEIKMGGKRVLIMGLDDGDYEKLKRRQVDLEKLKDTPDYVVYRKIKR